jgi:DNA-binding NtrC family response regulator
VWYEVLATSDPRRALGWLQHEVTISVFVTEHVDQAFDGMSLLEIIRTQDPEIQRIVLTTYSDLARLIDGLHSGAIQKLVKKPINRHEFLTAIAPSAARAAAMAPQPSSNIARAG